LEFSIKTADDKETGMAVEKREKRESRIYIQIVEVKWRNLEQESRTRLIN
jgi:hypothetical protein